MTHHNQGILSQTLGQTNAGMLAHEQDVHTLMNLQPTSHVHIDMVPLHEAKQVHIKKVKCRKKPYSILICSIKQTGLTLAAP